MLNWARERLSFAVSCAWRFNFHNNLRNDFCHTWSCIVMCGVAAIFGGWFLWCCVAKGVRLLLHFRWNMAHIVMTVRMAPPKDSPTTKWISMPRIAAPAEKKINKNKRESIYFLIIADQWYFAILQKTKYTETYIFN